MLMVCEHECFLTRRVGGGVIVYMNMCRKDKLFDRVS
jgi:hypothetical protein